MTEKKKRPRILTGKTTKISTGCGNLYVILNPHDGQLFEIFGTLGKSGTCVQSQIETVARLVTLSLRYNVPLLDIVKQIKGIECDRAVWFEGKRILSCTDAIAKVLEEYILNQEKKE